MENQENVVAATEKQSLTKKVAVGAGVVTATLLPAVAMAADAPAPPDFTPIVTMITGLVAVVASVGMAVLTVYATAKVFKWVKTAF